MSTTPRPLLKVATIAVAVTLMSGFVIFRHSSGTASTDTMQAAPPPDSPETKAAAERVRIDSFYMDPSLPSSKSGMIVPPDHPAFQQPQVRVDSPSRAPALPSSKSGIMFPPADEQTRRTWLSTSKSGTVFEPPSIMVNDSVLQGTKAQDTLE